jgi:hypothetical protein
MIVAIGGSSGSGPLQLAIPLIEVEIPEWEATWQQASEKSLWIFGPRSVP